MKLGWTYRGSRYCQLICQANKEKRLDWARAHLHDDFEDVVWSDETTVQLECHKRFCCRKERRATPPKTLCEASSEGACVGWNWMAWSMCFRWHNGCTNVRTYSTGCSPAYTSTTGVYPKHTSRIAKAFFDQNGVNWWRIPPESPDANPIENLWHELKVSEYHGDFLHVCAS